MYGIGGTARPAAPSGPRAASRPGSFRLPRPRATEIAETATVSGTAAVGLVALQEDGDLAGRDRRGHARAQALLEELAALQAEMLRGGADADRLSRLAQLTEGEAPADPVLADALAGIGLRARVELARRGIMVAPP
ncbi:flagellar assembly protein FliX [Roseomonas sp. WA12]